VVAAALRGAARRAELGDGADLPMPVQASLARAFCSTFVGVKSARLYSL